MSSHNPTPIKVGMTGTFAGKQYRVAGRIVMGMEEEGETYYWNEFHLVAADDDFITLVNEPGDYGDVWRLFTMFEPQTPMTAQQATAVRVGQRVNLAGSPVRVTLVDESQVHYIEGEPPEGVEVGDVARYFNAETTNAMLVVSWTGDEVECFRGVVIQRQSVAKAFNIPMQTLQKSAAATATYAKGDSESSNGSGKLWITLAIVAVIVGMLLYKSHSRGTFSLKGRAKVVRKTAPTLPAGMLSVGDRGTLNGKTYQVRGRAAVEISEVGIIHRRHEFLLTDSDNDDNRALLIYPARQDAAAWLLLEALPLATALRPYQVAGLRLNEPFAVDGVNFRVKQMFQSVALTSNVPDEPTLNSGAVMFGLVANEGSQWLQARWGESVLSLHRGKFLSEKEVNTAFGKK